MFFFSFSLVYSYRLTVYFQLSKSATVLCCCCIVLQILVLLYKRKKYLQLYFKNNGSRRSRTNQKGCEHRHMGPFLRKNRFLPIATASTKPCFRLTLWNKNLFSFFLLSSFFWCYCLFTHSHVRPTSSHSSKRSQCHCTFKSLEHLFQLPFHNFT